MNEKHQNANAFDCIRDRVIGSGHNFNKNVLLLNDEIKEVEMCSNSNLHTNTHHNYRNSSNSHRNNYSGYPVSANYYDEAKYCHSTYETVANNSNVQETKMYQNAPQHAVQTRAISADMINNGADWSGLCTQISTEIREEISRALPHIIEAEVNTIVAKVLRYHGINA